MKIFAILSDHRAHKSASPRMHNTVIKDRNLENEYCYIPLEIHLEQLSQAIAGFRALNFAGANVTIPYKEQVGEFLDEISENARQAGAVNTIIRRDNRLMGDNSDIGGYIDSLAINKISPRGKTVCIVGNGGAARGLIVGLKNAGAAKIIIAGRNREKAAALAAEFAVSATTISEITELRAIDIITNATAVSTEGESSELAAIINTLHLSNLEGVVDINYGRTNSFWEALAARTGARFIDGLPMLALQARISFEMWTGIPVTKSEYLQALGIAYQDE